MPRLTIILDLDGVLITNSHWNGDDLHDDGYSAFNQGCVNCFNEFLNGLDAEVWVISTRRKGKLLPELQAIFRARGIHAPIVGLVPVYGDNMNRKDEVLRFIRENNLQHYLIIDDNTLLNRLPRDMKNRLVITQYLLGFNEEKLGEAREVLQKVAS